MSEGRARGVAVVRMANRKTRIRARSFMIGEEIEVETGWRERVVSLGQSMVLNGGVKLTPR